MVTRIVRMRPGAGICLTSLIAILLPGCADVSQDKNQRGADSSVSTGVPDQPQNSEQSIESDATQASRLQGPETTPLKGEGRFPLVPDALATEWKQAVQLPTLPTVSIRAYSCAHNPFFAFGFRGPSHQSESWNLATGEKIGAITITDSTPNITTRSLSADGTRIAFWDNERKVIDIWSYESGKPVTQIPLGRYATFLLASPDRILVSLTDKTGAKSAFRLRLYDVNSGELLIEHPPVTDSSEVLFLLSAKVSSTGRYIASYDSQQGFRIFETDTLQRVATIPVKALPKSSGSCAFSHDGTRLAGLSSNADEAWLFVASLSDGSVRQLSFNEAVKVRRQHDVNGTPPIEWLPDDSGWLFGGDTIVDAELEKCTWKFERGLANHTRSIIFPGTLVQPGSNYDRATKTGGAVLWELKWPQQHIQSMVRSLQAGSPVELQPGDSISVTVDVGKLISGDVNDTAKAISESVKARLWAIGLKVAPGGDAPVLLSVRYSEAPGRLMRKDRSYLSAVPAGVTSGIRSVVATIELTMRHQGDNGPFWSRRAVEDPFVLSVRGRTDLQTIRESVFKKMQEQLRMYPIPYLVTESGELPGITEQVKH